ncbi:MAG: prepilin-type N-terminal cleavage/methylation domain-containing protein [Pyrinomonadaceae bacterium]|nr:prepilin-type N-terminal cleavage/methylation domain-containing protein [Pyrinomonadaceae bacterium]
MRISVHKCGQVGFSLVEVLIALVILLVALLGVFYTFTFSIGYNFGNTQRVESVAIIQRELEAFQCAKFSPQVIDETLIGGIKTPKIVTTMNGNAFLVETVIDDDPFSEGIQTDNSKTIKEITVTVRSENPGSKWQTGVLAKTVFRRVRGY